jgi:uncharacterized Zn finger protein
MNTEEMSGSDWIQWAQLEKTREFCRLLGKRVQEHQEDWLQRQYEDAEHHVWVTKNAAALAVAGTLATLKQTIENLAQGEQNDKTDSG